MHDRTEWTRGTTIRTTRGKELFEFARPCATCGKSFSVFVNQKIADGEADSNSFGLKNCEEHRRNNRPAKRDWEAELAVLYERDKAQVAEIQQLKAQLHAYELFRK